MNELVLVIERLKHNHRMELWRDGEKYYWKIDKETSLDFKTYKDSIEYINDVLYDLGE